MGVKGDNLELISGLLLSSFILNYMLIRVKRKGLEYENRKKRERKGRNDRPRERGTKRTTELWGISLFDRNSSVDVGYGLCYFIVNS